MVHVNKKFRARDFLLVSSSQLSPRLNSEPKQRTRDDGVIPEVVRASVALASRVVATSLATRLVGEIRWS